MVRNHQPFPTAFPPSGTLTDVPLSYQSQGIIAKHFAMKMQGRGLFPPTKEDQLLEVMTAGRHAHGTRAAPSAHHTPEERGCPLQEPHSALLPGAQGPYQAWEVWVAMDMGVPRVWHTGEERTAPGDRPLQLLPAACSHPYSAHCFQWQPGVKRNLLCD